MSAIPTSDNCNPNVSSTANYSHFAAMSQGAMDWTKYIPAFQGDWPPRDKWCAREDARWLIIRDALRACAKKGIKDVARRMELLGCPGSMGLFDILQYIATIWDPKTSGVCDLQWLAGWDIEFCRATGDWSLVLFNLGLLRQAAEFHGQLPPSTNDDDIKCVRERWQAYKNLQHRVARAVGKKPICTWQQVSSMIVSCKRHGCRFGYLPLEAAFLHELASIETLISSGRQLGSLREECTRFLAYRKLKGTREEFARIERELSPRPQQPSNGKGYSSLKPRIVLRCGLELNGVIFAGTYPSSTAIAIGRVQEAEQ